MLFFLFICKRFALSQHDSPARGAHSFSDASEFPVFFFLFGCFGCSVCPVCVRSCPCRNMSACPMGCILLFSVCLVFPVRSGVWVCVWGCMLAFSIEKPVWKHSTEWTRMKRMRSVLSVQHTDERSKRRRKKTATKTKTNKKIHQIDCVLWSMMNETTKQYDKCFESEIEICPMPIWARACAHTHTHTRTHTYLLWAFSQRACWIELLFG